MSFEDTELKDILAQTLESNGSLAKIRAQLRACIYLAFDEDELMHKKQPLVNNKVQQKLETPVGKLMFKVVREFLEFLDLDYTISVYDSESYMGKDYNYEGRNKLVEDLNLDVHESVPVLYQLIKQAQVKDNTFKQNGVTKSIEMDSTFNLTSPTIHFDSPQPTEIQKKSERSVKIGLNTNLLDSTINDFSSNKLSPQKINNNLMHLQLKKSQMEMNNSFKNSLIASGEDNYEEDFVSDSEIVTNRSGTSQDFELDSNNFEDILKSNN